MSEKIKEVDLENLVNVPEDSIMDIDEKQYMGILIKKANQAYQLYLSYQNVINEVSFLKSLDYRMMYAVNKKDGTLLYKFEDKQCGFKTEKEENEWKTN